MALKKKSKISYFDLVMISNFMRNFIKMQNIHERPLSTIYKGTSGILISNTVDFQHFKPK